MIRFYLPLVLSVIAGLVSSQENPPPGGPPQGDARAKMWPAPTAEDWKRPCLITFQRTWKDALAVSKETKKAILICVNMDGEIASEHYAGIRYRQPEIAALYKPYVCVIASVYRHNPRDYDDQGNRIPCPRFGCVTCGEHIAIEPPLYKKYFDGKRIAPRHIMIELGGEEKYDVYYAFDTDSVFNAISGGIANRTIKPLNIVRGDRSLVERVASRDISDRMAVEKAFLSGDKTQRLSLLNAAVQNRDADPLGLLRLAVFGFDLELSKIARQALTKSQADGAIDLIAEALRVPMEAKERDALIGALERFGAKSTRARTAAVVQRGLTKVSDSVKVDEWSRSFAGGVYKAPKADFNALVSKLDKQAEETKAKPKDAQHFLELAESSLAYALAPETWQSISADRRTSRKYARMVFQDVLGPARRAEDLGAKGWRLDMIVALATYYLGRFDAAYARAEKAVKEMPAGTKGWNAMALLSLFAAGRQQAITKAVRAKEQWPHQWLTDVHATYSVLAKHPLCTDAQVVSHFDFLYPLGAYRQARKALEEGLKRFPDSWELHKRFRNTILMTRGCRALEKAYAESLSRENAPANLAWFAGFASLVSAETHRRGGRMSQARASYKKSIGLYDLNIKNHPGSRENSDHYAALALAGLARLSFESQDYPGALEEILSSFKRRPQAGATLDGLGFSPVTTAKLLLQKFEETKKVEAVKKLQAALVVLKQLDPKLLDPPAFDTGGTPGPGANRFNRGNRAGGSQGNRPNRRPRRR